MEAVRCAAWRGSPLGCSSHGFIWFCCPGTPSALLGATPRADIRVQAHCRLYRIRSGTRAGQGWFAPEMQRSTREHLWNFLPIAAGLGWVAQLSLIRGVSIWPAACFTDCVGLFPALSWRTIFPRVRDGALHKRAPRCQGRALRRPLMEASDGHVGSCRPFLGEGKWPAVHPLWPESVSCFPGDSEVG